MVIELGEYFKKNDLILDHPHSIQLTSTALDDKNPGFVLKMIKEADQTELPENAKIAMQSLEEDIHHAIFDGYNFRIEVSDNQFNTLENP